MTELEHYGTPRRSGRYPWGSGDEPYQSADSFLGMVKELQSKGLTEVEIAKGFGMSTGELRNRKSIAKNEKRAADAALAYRLKEKGMSNVAIGERMGIGESSVRQLLNDSLRVKNQTLSNTAEMLKENVEKLQYVDVGPGVSNHLGISRTQLKTAVQKLKDEGYTIHYIREEQLGNPGNFTTIQVLAAPGVKYGDVYKERVKVSMPNSQLDDTGLNFEATPFPKSVSAKRISIAYDSDGGSTKDGVIELRRGVDDISLGSKNYAQVRIAVDGTHYLKGMAVYADDLPKGVDIRFNTNKSDTGNKFDAMKPFKNDSDNPFGAVARTKFYIDKDGNRQQSSINVLNEEGTWDTWSRTLSSQMLSKQNPSLAKNQLGLSYDRKQAEYDEIMSLTNPTIRKKLLQSFSDSCDSAAVHLKAAALPRQSSRVILPVNSLKDNEIFAPGYKNGEKVVLIRHPHGGIFEIPELTVNNKNTAAKRMLGDAIDAVGVNHKVAGHLSGADFDGDTVLVIPNNSGAVKTAPALAKLKDFNPSVSYPKYDGMKAMTKKQTQSEMGKISNLITDMTIRGASMDELARAVRHSMVVIDAEKHNLNYKQSELDNNIPQLKNKYQGRSDAGAATLISKSSSEINVAERKARAYRDGGPIDPATGRKMYTPTGESYIKTTVSERTGAVKEKVIQRHTRSTKMAETDDARTLSSGTVIESVYATHANKLKALGNQARKSLISTPNSKYSPSAARTYAPEVESLKAKLNIAVRNSPLERKAQLLGTAMYDAKRQANSDLDKNDLRKLKAASLNTARARVGAKKTLIEITAKEWEAIQAGAISNNRLSDILDNADLNTVKQLAMPREHKGMSNAKTARAKAMLNRGYTMSEISDALGFSPSTIRDAIK